MPTVGDGVHIMRMGRREAIPRHMSIGEVRVKIAYAGQQQVCDLCDAPGQIAQNCPYRNKCFQCGLKGHFSRNCPQLVSYRDRVSVLDELDPPLLKPLAVLSLLLPFRLSQLMFRLVPTRTPCTGCLCLLPLLHLLLLLLWMLISTCPTPSFLLL